MTGLTTTDALYKLQESISKALHDTKHVYTSSPFLTWHTLISLAVYISWIVFCALYVSWPIAAVMSTVLVLTILCFAADTYLSSREKGNSVRDVLDILQSYNVSHDLPSSRRNSGKPGFYLSETYPSSTSVSVRRAYRNGKVVSVSRSLLVEGDIILLSPGEEAPTDCSALTDGRILKRGDIFEEETSSKSESGKHCVIDQPKLAALFAVHNTDYKRNVREFLLTNRLPSKLTLDIRCILKVLNLYILPVMLVASVGASVLQNKWLPSGYELQAPLVTLLPLLPTLYPVYYTVLYHICTAIVIHMCQEGAKGNTRDIMKTPDDHSNNNIAAVGSQECDVKKIFGLTYKSLVGKLYRYLPRNSNIFDTLSAVTILSTVNKEGILSRPNPHVERIMLLDPATDDQESKEDEVSKDLNEALDPLDEDEQLDTPDTVRVISRLSDIDGIRLISCSSQQSESETEYTPIDRPIPKSMTASSLPNIHTQAEDTIKHVRSFRESLVGDSKFSINSDYTKLSGDDRESACSETYIPDDIRERSGTSGKLPVDRKSKLWLPKLKSNRKPLSRLRVKSDCKDDKESNIGLRNSALRKESEDLCDLKESDLEMSPMVPFTENKTKKKKKPLWSMLKIPRYRALRGENEYQATPTDADSTHSNSSLKDDFIVLLNVSLSKHSPFGITFDHTDLAQLKGSLKPIGLAVLLNNLCHDPRTATTSHLTHISVQSYSGVTFKLLLPTDYCNCVVGREIGFTRSVLQQYQRLSTVVTYVPCTMETARPTQRNPADNLTPVTCVISSVVRDKTTDNRHLMSYGTAQFILRCSDNYWNGKEVLPLLSEHRARVIEFYNQNRLTCHCFVVAYRPLLGCEIAPQSDVFISLPKGYGFMEEACSVPLDPAENLLKLQSGQTLLGVICAQFQPKHDMVSTIETLVGANIRFVHFSYDNELRSRAFGTKLGLETGWNCHISLAEGDFDNFSVDSDSNEADQEAFHFYYCKARLPQGVKNIRPHLATVDNVPLLVPLFTSCTPPAISEMITIMQENDELVCCLGSSLQFDNFSIFMKADSSIGMIPHLPQHCLLTGIKDMTVPWESEDYLQPPHPEDFLGVNCLHLGSILNTLPCSLIVSRDGVSLDNLIRSARETCAPYKQSGYLAFSMYGALAFSSLAHQILLHPAPISLASCMFICLFVIPLLSTTPFTVNFTRGIMEVHTGKREAGVMDELSRNLKLFLFRWLTLLLFLPISSVLALDQKCADCAFLVGNSGPKSRFSARRVALVQLYNALTIVLVMGTNCFVLGHRIHRLDFKYFSTTFTRWTAVVPVVTCVTCALATLLVHKLSVPISQDIGPLITLLCIAFLPVIQAGLTELSKMWDRKLFTRHQRRQKLKFGTKLGMNSPF